jgi:hypothetical protein
MTITWKQFERYWYLFSLGVIVASLPFSKLLLSIGQMMIVGGWIVERFDYLQWMERMRPLSFSKRILQIIPYSLYLLFAGIISGFRALFRHKPALIFASIFLLHVAGLIFTTDFDYAIKDLRTKFPLLLLTLIISTSKNISEKEFFRYLYLFIAAVLVRTVFNTWMITHENFVDIRDISRNVSHIILSLQLVLAVYILAWFLFRKRIFSGGWKALFFGLLAWFLIYLVLSRSFTGISIALLTLLILLPFLVMTIRNTRIRIGLLATIIGIILTVFFSLRSVVRDYHHVNPVDLAQLDSLTGRGNPYINATYATETENGNYLWIYIQWDELREEWNKRSRLNFDSLDLKGQQVKHTVIRFLTSKGWRKDGDAVLKLTDHEITAIEKGVANAIFLQEFSIRGRIYEFLAGYDKYIQTGDPTGSTIMQRIEFWKASVGIISDNWLTGVGTGDMNIAFAQQYEKMNSKLAPDQRWRSHNQYLSILVGFGIFGLVWFLFAIFYPVIMMERSRDYFMLIILTIMMLAMLTEDTIESQTGLTFFALFYALFLFARFPQKQNRP